MSHDQFYELVPCNDSICESLKHCSDWCSALLRSVHTVWKYFRYCRLSSSMSVPYVTGYASYVNLPQGKKN